MGIFRRMGNLGVNLHLCPLTAFTVVFIFSLLICNTPRCNIYGNQLSVIDVQLFFHMFVHTVLHMCIFKQQNFRKLFCLWVSLSNFALKRNCALKSLPSFNSILFFFNICTEKKCQISTSDPEVSFGAVTVMTPPDVFSVFIAPSFVGLLFSGQHCHGNACFFHVLNRKIRWIWTFHWKYSGSLVFSQLKRHLCKAAPASHHGIWPDMGT